MPRDRVLEPVTAPDVRPIAEDSLGADREPLPRSAPCATFTTAQAERGRAIYDARCAQCHGPTLRGGDHSPPLTARFFDIDWQDRRVSALHATVRETMPPGEEESLSPAATSRLVAYILQVGGVRPGAELLAARADALVDLRICTGTGR